MPWLSHHLQQSLKRPFKTGQVVEEKLSEDVLLPTNEIKMWLYHLRTVQENRKRGAAKADETKRSKQRQASKESEEYCGVYGDLYEEETVEMKTGLHVTYAVDGSIVTV